EGRRRPLVITPGRFLWRRSPSLAAGGRGQHEPGGEKPPQCLRARHVVTAVSHVSELGEHKRAPGRAARWWSYTCFGAADLISRSKRNGARLSHCRMRRRWEMTAPVLVVDTLSLAYRAFFALPDMRTTRGEPTGALYGFSALLLKLWREQRPKGGAFAIDHPRPTFRHAAFAGYKASRPPAPTPLNQQLARLPALLA